MNAPIEYVVGFLYGDSGKYVALIRKNKPEFQAGKLNGPGGKIEPGETALQAMRREWREETGQEHEDWTEFAVLSFESEVVHFFHGKTDQMAVFAKVPDGQEQVGWWLVQDVISGATCVKTLDNIPWLVLLSRDPQATFTLARCRS